MSVKSVNLFVLGTIANLQEIEHQFVKQHLLTINVFLDEVSINRCSSRYHNPITHPFKKEEQNQNEQ